MATRSLLRSPVALLMIFSWFASANHCALAAWSARPARHSCCRMAQQPAGQQQSSTLVCCKILRAATAPATIKAAAPRARLLTSAHAFFAALAAPLPPLDLFPKRLDTGPPRAVTLSEMVWQRSILAHAPPSLG